MATGATSATAALATSSSSSAAATSAAAASQRFAFAFNDERFSDHVLRLVRAPPLPLPSRTSSFPASSVTGIARENANETKVSAANTQRVALLVAPATEVPPSAQTGIVAEAPPEPPSGKTERSPLPPTTTTLEIIPPLDAPDDCDAQPVDVTSRGSDATGDTYEGGSDDGGELAGAGDAKTESELAAKVEAAAWSKREILARLHVSSAVLASDSRFFRTRFTTKVRDPSSKEISVQVADIHEAHLLTSLIRFIYTGDLTRRAAINCDGDGETKATLLGRPFDATDLIALLMLSDIYGIDRGIAACADRLMRNLSFDTSCRYMELSDWLLLHEGCRELTFAAENVIATKFKDFDAMWRGLDFLHLSAVGVGCVLRSESIAVRSENTVYRAACRWWRESPNSPGASNRSALAATGYAPTAKSVAAAAAVCLALIGTIRFHGLGSNFLADVVPRDQAWARRLPPTHAAEIAKTLADRVSAGVAFHACSGPRQQPFVWRVEGVSMMELGRYKVSPSFYVDGYWVRLQVGRIKWEREAFALFASLDLERSGITGQGDGFYLRTESQFSYTNQRTRLMTDIRTPSFDNFTTDTHELGYFDVFMSSWAALVAPGSEQVAADDSIALQLRIKIVE